MVNAVLKLEMQSKGIKDKEIGVNNKSDSQHKDDLVENTSAASTSRSITDEHQSNQMLAEEIASISKEVVVVKHEDSEVFTTDALALQNTDSKSEDCVVTSTSESSSPRSQEYKVPSEAYFYNTLTLAATELEESLKAEESDVCMADASYVQDSDNTAALTSQLNCNESLLSKIPSEENLLATEESKSTFNIEDSKSHRQNIHYSSESSDYETDKSSDSSDCDEFFDNLRKSVVTAKLPVLKTKGELLIEDLPPVEDLHITVNSTELLKIGSILHWVVAEERNEFLVIVESDGNSNPLDEDSVLFLSPDKPLGKIHDVFGSVSKPNYIVRFNNAEDIFNKSITTGQIVYYSPANGELTHYVLVDVLKQQKGSDASWKDNNEPPENEIDYSDDEQEKLAKQKRRAKTRGKERNWNDGEVQDVTPNKMERTDAAYSQKRVFKRASRNMFQSPTPGPSRSSPRSYSPQSFGLAPPLSDNFGSSRLPRNAVSPQSFGPTSSNSIPFRPFVHSNVQSPRPFGQFSHSNVQSPRPFGQFSHSNVQSPRPVGQFSHSNVQSPPPFGQFSHSNVQSPPPFGQLSHSNVQSPPPFGQFSHSNVQSPQPFGSFPQSSMSSYHPFTVPTTSYVLASPNLASSHATGAPQLNTSSFMAAPQNNVPLQQQLLLQPQQPITTYLSRPPPNYNSHQNSGTFLHQHQSFPPSMFGALSAARPTMQNTSNQLSVNQMLFSSGTNAAHIGLSGNLNISQSTNIAPMNSNGHQGQSYGMVQSSTANSFIVPQFPPRNTQHNNIHPPATETLVFAIHSAASPPPSRPTRPFVPCQTPPPVLLNQQGLSILSNPHPPISPSQTPPPLPNQHNLSIFSSVHPPVLPSQTPPYTVQFCTIPAPGDRMFAQNHRPC